MALRGDENIRAIENAEKVRKAIELHRAGYSWDDIAVTCKYASRGAAFTQVERFARKAIAETTADVEVYRYESLERLRELIKALWERRGDEKVAAEIRRCTERMDKLTGAERPTQLEFGESDVDRLLRDAVEEFRRRTGGDHRQAGDAAAAQAADGRG